MNKRNIHIAIISNAGGTGKSTTVEALRQILNSRGGANVVDLDPQKTLTYSYQLMGKKTPIQPGLATKEKYILYDSPPYFFEHEDTLIKRCDVIVSPFKLGPKDLLSFKPLYKRLKKLDVLGKTFVFANEVRRPLTRLSKYTLELFKTNYSDVKFCNTKISRLDSLNNILYKELNQKAESQFLALAKEIKILK